jgi:hypothetical protein
MRAAPQKAPCSHNHYTSQKLVNGDHLMMCAVCGKQWGKSAIGPKPKLPTLVLSGTHQEYVEFLKSRGINPYIQQDNGGTRYYEGGGQVAGVHFNRIVVIGTFRLRLDARKIFEYSRACLAQDGKVAYNDLLHGWYANKWDAQGDPIMHDAEGRLRCNWCRGLTNETYRTGICGACKNGKSMPSGIKSGGLHKVHPIQIVKGGQTQTFDLNGQVVNKPVHKEGDIWKLDKSNSPMWTEQWGYQGSAKLPYIISKKPEDCANGSTTVDGWACSCMNFTRHTPRTCCKHILNVMLKEGLGKAKPIVKGLATLTDSDEAEFMKWKRDQAALKKGAAEPTAGAKLNLFGATKRKFR